MYLERKIRALSRNHCCRGRAIIITYSECVFVALGVQPAKRMRHIVLSSVACQAVPVFPYDPTNGTIFGKKDVIQHKCVFRFSVQFSSETFIILRRTEREIVINIHSSPCKVRVIVVRV